MEKQIMPVYNHMIKSCEEFYEENQYLTQKDYAIKARSEERDIMPLLMNLYLGYDTNFEEFAIKNVYKIFGIKNPSQKK